MSARFMRRTEIISKGKLRVVAYSILWYGLLTKVPSKNDTARCITVNGTIDMQSLPRWN